MICQPYRGYIIQNNAVKSGFLHKACVNRRKGDGYGRDALTATEGGGRDRRFRAMRLRCRRCADMRWTRPLK
ncbi:hypothetical protein KCP71_15385 [Salmonella enterica subsp. enterica]|nr:hypothetical protein KCP71_15385 [Salmonella enterica subsp. enterica]